MATANDVAAYIVARQQELSAMKLQKLLYYSQAWHLVWDEEPLFADQIQAWANGPVVPAVYDHHRGRFSIREWPWGDPDALTEDEAETVDVVLQSYGGLDGRKLSYLTHSEDPWRNARGDLPPTARSHAEIAPDDLQDYYTAVNFTEEATYVDQLDWETWATRATS